jgi:flagellar biosynthesis chaperone FliJ
MKPRTRLDKVVQIRERAEDDALAGLARARSDADRARDRLARAVAVAQADGRSTGPVELWHLDELARRRALQAVRAAESDVRKAVEGEVTATAGYTAAHQASEVVRRVQERRQTEIVTERERQERISVDELATLRFNYKE